jgi:hypothetical protein
MLNCRTIKTPFAVDLGRLLIIKQATSRQVTKWLRLLGFRARV